MMYSQEFILPDEIPHVTYLSNENYKTAVENYIGRVLAINKKAKEKNQGSARKSKKYFDRKYVKKASHKILFWETLY